MAGPAEKLLGGSPNLGTFDRGASEPAFQSQRAGERADFTAPAPPTYFSSAEGSLGPITTGFQPEPSFNTEFLGGLEGGDMGGGFIPSSSGVGAGVGAGSELGSPAAGGMNIGGGAAAAPGIGAGVAGGLGGGLALYNLAKAIQGGSGSQLAGASLGTLASIPGAISAAAAAGVPGAAAAAQAVGAAMSGAAVPLAVLAPVIVGALGWWQQQEGKEAARGAALKARGTLGQAQNTVAEQGLQMGSLDPNQVDPSKTQDYINALGRMFQTQDPTSGVGQMRTAGIALSQSPMENAYQMAKAGPNPSATGDNQAQMNEYGQNILAGVPAEYQRMAYLLSQNPNLSLPSWEVGGQKTADVLKDQAMGMNVAGQGGPAPDYSSWYEHIPGTPNPYTTIQENGQEVILPNPELGGQYPKELLSSPYFAQQYWQNQGVSPQEAFLYGTAQQAQKFGGMGGYQLPGTPGEYDPAAIYQSLVAQGMPSLDAQQAAMQQAPQATEQVGAITPGPAGSSGVPGAEAVSGAGKLSPNFITPELDLRAEAVQGAGRLGGGAQGGRGAGTQPFGMGAPRTGGMQAGMPPRGGMQPQGGAGGNSPFGGVPRQTMMPQPGGGVMQRRSNQGSRGAV